MTFLLQGSPNFNNNTSKNSWKDYIFKDTKD